MVALSRSANLHPVSVLQRKTEPLKDFFSLGHKICQAHFDTTYFYVDCTTGRELACKSIALWKLLTDEGIEDVRREIQIMHHIRGHPSMVTMVGASDDVVAVHLVTDLCGGGELFHIIFLRGINRRRRQRCWRGLLLELCICAIHPENIF